MKRKLSGIKTIILIIVIALAVMLGLSVKNIREDNKLNFFEKAIKDTGNYILKVVNMPINYIDNKIEEKKEMKEIYKKYKKLLKKEEKTDFYISRLEELESENKELKETLELNSTLSSYKYVNATVINRNISTWNNVLTIDKGSKSNIKLGDAVIVPDGLIGKIVDVSNFTSSVKLLTTDEITNKISVKLKTTKGNYVYGLFIGYDSNSKVYKIEGIEDCSDIKEGAKVKTTGLTDYFPSGLMIGRVDSIIKDEYDLTHQVTVKPTVDFNTIKQVTVLQREDRK